MAEPWQQKIHKSTFEKSSVHKVPIDLWNIMEYLIFNKLSFVCLKWMFFFHQPAQNSCSKNCSEFLGDFEVKNMNYTTDFESIAREALRVLLVIFVASLRLAFCAVRPAH